MKKIVFCSVILALTMVAAPVIFSGSLKNTGKEDAAVTKNSEEKVPDSGNSIKDKIFYYAEKNSDIEYLKALSVIISTNQKVNKDSAKSLTQSESKKKFKNSYKELSKNIDKAIKATAGETIEYNGKAVYIPFSPVTNGSSAKGASPYLVPCASPWDKQSKLYSAKTPKAKGVSLCGLKALTTDGISYKNALSHYLPKCRIDDK